jgi:hypothetical protein
LLLESRLPKIKGTSFEVHIEKEKLVPAKPYTMVISLIYIRIIILVRNH